MMDQLETQVSDLRSFLDPNATNPTVAAAAAAPGAIGITTSSSSNGRRSGPGAPVPAAAVAAATPLSTPHLPPQPPPFGVSTSSTNILSAPYGGDNSAHNSPISISPPPHHHPHGHGSQHAHHHSRNLSTGRGPTSAAPNPGNAAAGPIAGGNNKSKRQASEAALSDDGAPGSTSGKQQRAKRNRVCFKPSTLPYLTLSCHIP